MLDIDYTLFDHRSSAENPLQLMRPCEHSPYGNSTWIFYVLAINDFNIILCRSSWVSDSCLCWVWYHDMVCNQVRFFFLFFLINRFFFLFLSFLQMHSMERMKMSPFAITKSTATLFLPFYDFLNLFHKKSHICHWSFLSTCAAICRKMLDFLCFL